MNKKIFKRLLIATTMLSPVAIVTPMILTSCNDNNPTAGAGIDEKAIQLSNISSLFKERSKNDSSDFLFGDDVPELDNHYWLESIDIKKDTLTIESQVKKLVDGLIQNKQQSLFDLTQSPQSFQLYKMKTDNSGYEKIDSITNNGNEYLEKDLLFKKSKYSKENDTNNLKTVFGDVFLSNREFQFGGQVDSNDKNSLVINGGLLNVEQLLEKTEIQSRIKIIDKEQNKTGNNSMNDIYSTNNFVIQYLFKPKDGFYWSGIKGEKNNLPLIITIKDNVDKIELVSDLNSFQPNTTNASDKKFQFITSTNITLENSETFDAKTVVKKIFNIDVTAASETNKELTDQTKTLSFFEGLESITGTDKDTNNNNPKKVSFSNQNFKNSLTKNRVEATLLSMDESKKDEATNPTINLKVGIKLVSSISGRTNPDYTWFINGDNTNNVDVIPFEFDIKISKNN